MAKDAGANKVFFTSAAPPVRFPHVYGINMPNRDELIAHDRTISQIADQLEIDNLVYQSVENLRKSIICLLYTSPSPRDRQKSRMPSSA